MSNFDPTRQIAIIWDIDDVKSIAKGITDEQAMTVLREVGWNHDSEYGVNWDTIVSWVNELYPEIETSLCGFEEEE
jgi:hypothetical protein